MIWKMPIKVTVRGEMIGRNDRGNPIYGPDVETVYRGEFRPLAGDEMHHDGELILQRYRVFLPGAATLDGTARIEILGDEYKLLGHPEKHNLGGRVRHLEAIVERRTG